MATAEQMAQSIRIEGHGIFVLLWDAKEDLVRSLLVLEAVLYDIPKRSLLLAPGAERLASLRGLIETSVIITSDGHAPDAPRAPQACNELWFLFLQQASSEVIGPRVNGWRGPLHQSPGTILVIRHADFEPFQRSAPDLASFVGPRIYSASTMLSVISRLTYERVAPNLPEAFSQILRELPGEEPSKRELAQWIAACRPAEGK